MLTAINKYVSSSRTHRNLAFIAAALLPFAGVLAQSSLPDELVRRNDISADDRQAIKALVDAHKSGLSGGTIEIKKSRDVLLAPLEKDGVSVPFRVAYANALIESGEIDKLAANKDNDLIAANALRIAGQSATGNTLKIVIDALKDTRPQVRYAATVGARAAFNAARNNSALSPDEVSRAMRALSDVATTDAAPEPADGALQALVAARDIQGNRSLAVERLTEAAGTTALTAIKSGKPIDLTPLLRVATPIQHDVVEVQKLTPAAKKGVATFAAQLLLAVDAQWKDGDPDPSAVQAARTASTILALAASNMAGQEVTIRVGELVTAGKQEQFHQALARLVGPGGLLQSPPLSIAPDKLKP